MANTLILYDGRQSSAERVANAIGYIIGNVRIAEIGESPEEISVYDGFCFIFNFYGALTAGKTKSYLLKNREGLLGKRIAFVGLGFSDAGFTKYVVDMEFAVGGDLSITGMFIKDERTTSEVGYQIAKKLRAPVSVMPAEELSREVDAFVNRHTTMALSTGGGNRIRCTPLEYLYLDGIFYIISEGGLKFSNILDNSNVSAAIFDEYTGNSQPLAGLQMYGVAEQVAVGSDDYWNILAYRGVTEEVLRDLPVTLFVLRIIPMTYEYLNSTFAESGYDARQVLSTRFRAERWESSYASLHAAALKEAQEKAKEKEKSAVQQDKAAEKSENEEPTDNASVDMLIPEEPAETAFVEEETAEPAAQVLSEPEKTAVPEDLSAEPVVEVFPETESAVTEEAEEVFDEADNGTEDETPSVKISEETASEESVDAEIGDFKEETDEKPEETVEIQTTSSVESREISGENLFRNSQIRNEDGSYENINAQKHNMGAEIRKIFQGGGLSFADQLEKQRAEEEGLAPEETEDEKMPMKGIFEEESAYRNSIPRTSSFIEEENTESEEEEKKETYTLEDLERDSKPDEETDKTDSGKKKKFTDLFRKSEREELFDEESFADEFDEIYEEDNEEEIEFEEQPVTRTPKKKKQGGFFATGFGRSIGRFLGISPDMEDEDDEDEDEDFDEALEEEDDDFDLSDDDEDLEGAEPGWMVRLRELREDEEVEADDAELYGSGADSGEDTDESSEDSGSEEAAESGEPEESINISSEETGSADVPENDEEPQAEHDAEIDAISKALLQKLEDAEKEAGRDSEISDARSGNDRIGTVSAAADSEYVDEFELEDEEYESARVLERKQETAVSGTGDAGTEDESESDEIEESDEEESGKEEPDATENESSLTEIDDASGESESDETGAEPEETDFEIKTESGEVEFEIETESGEVEFEETESEPVEPELEPEEDKSEDDAFEDEFESEDADFEEVSEKDTDLSRHETVDFEEVSDSEKPMVKAASVKDEKKEKKAGTGKKPFEALKKKLFGDLEEEEYDPDDLDDDDLYDGDDDFDDDEFDDRSFITNFTEVLRLAIGGKSGKSKKSRIRLPEKEEKVREDDEELMEVEALISGLAEKEADSENQPEPSDSYEEEPAEEPEESDSYEEEPAEEPEEYPEEETAAPTASESAEPDEEFDVDKYDDSQLDFADDDDSDIIIPGTTRASMSDIVIRGFDDDPLEAETDEDDESDEDDEDDDWEADYRRLKLASLSGKPADYDEAEDDLNEETEVDISVKESEEKDDLYDAYDDDDAYEDDVYDDDDYEDVEWIYEEDDDVADAPFESV